MFAQIKDIKDYMLKQMYMISKDKINKWIEKKQAREAERMEKNEQERNRRN